MATVSTDRWDMEENQVFEKLEYKMKRQIYPLEIFPWNLSNEN